MTNASALNSLIVEDAATFRRLFKELLLNGYPLIESLLFEIRDR
jgi:hypothetical protein